ncbi:MAG: 2-amino-4-hydroxy-6-hydroxymethyldihydropteridine diphosphokinase [Tannerellaceae bacterium]|nr:2-amino-4-hydroxy-6-hydroxymethyldihydropteridine diphosphokinase [Tannerellaceae bacterium]
MAEVFLSLGTNLGDKENNLSDAIEQIKKQIGDIISQSAFYITEPWGFQSVHSFLNAVILINTPFSPQATLQKSQQIERKMGRKAKSHNGTYTDRIIDIDILLYNNEIIQEEGLIIPHPHMEKRLFVMKPLTEITPDRIHPVLKKTFRELLEDIQSSSSFT